MGSDILQAAFEAHLSPIVCRIAQVVAQVEGEEQARTFVASCRRERDTPRLSASCAVRLRPGRDVGAADREAGTLPARDPLS